MRAMKLSRPRIFRPLGGGAEKSLSARVAESFSLCPQHPVPDISMRAQREGLRQAWWQVGGLMREVYRREGNRVHAPKK